MKVAMNNTVYDPFYGKINYDLSEGEKNLSPNIWGGLPMVTCPDGTKDIANGFVPPCMGKYGNNKPTEEQRRLQIADELTKQAQAFQNQQIQGSTTKEPIYYILVTAGVLVAGYFAYKKFKKM
jgi:hypothetical protein